MKAEKKFLVTYSYFDDNLGRSLQGDVQVYSEYEINEGSSLIKDAILEKWRKSNYYSDINSVEIKSIERVY